MKANNPNITELKVKLNTENAFICGRGSVMKDVAKTQLAALEAQGNTVLVTDPYLFTNKADTSYASDIEEILKSLQAKSIIYCAGNIQDTSLFQAIQTALQANGCQLIHNAALTDCHDRFWLCVEKDKAVVFGTSLNGLCKRICRIDELNADEVDELKNELTARGIL